MPLKGLHSVVVLPATLAVTAGAEQSRSRNPGDRTEMEKLTSAERGRVVMSMLAVDIKEPSHPLSFDHTLYFPLKLQNVTNQPIHSPITDSTYN